MVTDRNVYTEEIEKLNAENDKLLKELSVVSLQNMALNREIDGLKKENREAALELLRIMGQLADQAKRQHRDDNDLLNNVDAYGPIAAAIVYTWGTRCSEYQPGCTCCKVWDEFDRLSKNVNADGEIASLLNVLADTRAENMRLRAALERIAANTYGFEPNAMSDEEAKVYFANLFFAAQGKARAALAQPAAPGGE